MDTRIVYIVVISIAVSGLIWQMAGFSELFTADSPGDDLKSGDKLEKQAQDSAVEGNFTSDTRANQGSLVGTIISGGSAIFSMIGIVVFLPGELMNLMLPRWFAQPVGTLASILISMGLIQFVTGRVFR